MLLMIAWLKGMRARIIEGILIGVASGLVLSVVYWINTEARQRLQKTDQVQHITKIIETKRKVILSSDPHEIPGATIMYSDLRRRRFERMLRGLETVLRERSSSLSADEINAASKILSEDSLVVDENLLTEEIYNYFFFELEAIKWSGLPSRAVAERKAHIAIHFLQRNR